MNLSLYLLFLLTSLVFHVLSQDVGLRLESEGPDSRLPNNAIVSANSIGRISGQSLVCFTMNTDMQDVGEWRGPDGSVISQVFSDTFYVLRLPGAVMLFRGSRSLTSELEGVYTCRIPDSNGNEQVLYVGIYLQENFVNGSPQIPSPPTFDLLTPFDQFPPTFRLSCTSISYPPTNVTWLLDDVPISDTVDFQRNKTLLDSIQTRYINTLTVTGNYSGEFTCEVTNAAGTGRNMYSVTEPLVPPMLEDPKFLGSGNVDISWTQPEDEDYEVYGYQLFYRLSSDPGSEIVVDITGPDIARVMLQDLQAGATYIVTILSYADLPTERSEMLYLTLNVADPVENVSVISNSSTSLLVSWNHTGMNVVNYLIFYQPLNDTSCPELPQTEANKSALQNSTHYLLTGLEEDTDYSVSISTVSEAAAGNPTQSVIGRTMISSPSGPPTNIVVTPRDPNVMSISWDPPSCLNRNGPIVNYTIKYTDLFVRQTQNVTISRTDIILTNTSSPFRNVSFIIQAVTSSGRGPFSAPIYRNLIGNPRMVANLESKDSDITSITVGWRVPDLIEFVFSRDFNYTVTWSNEDETSVGTKSGISSSIINVRYRIPNLAPNTMYTINVVPFSSYSMGIPVSIQLGTTMLGRVSNLEVIQNTETSVNVSWTLVDSRDVIFYEIYYNHTENSTEVFNTSSIDEKLSLVTIEGLNSHRTYDFTIAAVVYGNNDEIRGPRSNVVEFTFSLKSNRQLIIIVVCSTIGGLLLLIVVIIVTMFFMSVLSKNLGPQLANIKTVDEGYVPLNLLHVPLELEEVDSSSSRKTPPTVTGQLSGDIHAVEGQELVLKYSVMGVPQPSLQWLLDGEELDSESSSFFVKGNTIIFKQVEIEHSGLYTLKAVNANGSCEKCVNLLVYPDAEITRYPSEQDSFTTLSKTVGEFGQYVARLHVNSNRLFKEQFRMLSSGEVSHSVKDVLAEENRRYNRFQHIVVYDDNRITLELLPRYLDCQHAYINACYIKGEGEKCRRFIATQGPLEHTVADIWRLVWQEKAPAIVMLTKTKEDLRIKCSQYWPNKGSEQYGPFTVKLLQETVFKGYIVRELTIHYNTLAKNIRSKLVNPIGKSSMQYKQPFSNVQSTLRVIQYHYTDWEEHGSVVDITSLLEMHQKVTTTVQNIHPIVVHCSNGAGRTGAFIALDMALEQCKKQETVDVPAIVVDIRNQRMKMIQTLDQYMLVHDAVVEKIICKDNCILVKDLHNALKNLDDKIDGTSETGYENQFNVLCKVTLEPGPLMSSYAQQFPQKNRENHALPSNQWCVPLKGESPDYINATYVTGYNNDRAYIITQGPLRETRRDFWKLIYDQDISTVVMLSENDQEVCAQYWPSSGNVEFGEFVIVVKDTTSNEGFTRRILLLKETKSGSLRRIIQYQITSCLDGDHIPLEVINTINLVTTTQRKMPNIPLLIHCSDGFGQSAIFCAAMATIEQCKVEGVVNVFQFVKKMRSQLPGVIANKDQYRNIYRTVAAYLDLFSTSANFEHLC